MGSDSNQRTQLMAIPVVIHVIVSIRDMNDDNLHESERFARLLPATHLFVAAHVQKALQPSKTFLAQNCDKPNWNNWSLTSHLKYLAMHFGILSLLLVFSAVAEDQQSARLLSSTNQSTENVCHISLFLVWYCTHTKHEQKFVRSCNTTTSQMNKACTGLYAALSETSSHRLYAFS